MRLSPCLILFIPILACAPRSWPAEPELAGETLAVWDLVADPNPMECVRMRVRITTAGGVCGICEVDGEEQEHCGGPGVGVPYMVAPLRHNGRLDLIVTDLYGSLVQTLFGVVDVCVSAHREEGTICTICSDAEGAIAYDSCADEEAEADENCLALVQSDGSGCTLCADAQGVATYNDCAEYGGEVPIPAEGGGGEAGGTEEMIGEAAGCFPLASDDSCMVCFEGETEEIVCEDPSTSGTGEGFESCYEAGVRAYIDELDGTLEQWGLASSGLLPQHVDDEPGFGQGLLAGTMCSPLFGNTQASDGAYLRDGDLRCAAIGTDVVVEACDHLPEDCGDESLLFRQGVVAAYQVWSAGSDVGGWGTMFGDGDLDGGGSTAVDEFSPNPDLPECTGSPLVFDLQGGGIELVSREEGVAFDLMGSGRAVQTGWVGRGSLLALDLDGDGQVSSGRELFGEATLLISGVAAHDGFAALAQYDRSIRGGNLDGRIDIEDEVFMLLRLWTDSNLDGQSQPEELISLTDAGVSAIGLAGRKTLYPASASAGNDVGLRGSFEWADGRQGEVYDVWFRYTALPLICI